MRFTQVEWPTNFQSIVEDIRDQPIFNFDIFDSMLPVDCILPNSLRGPYAKTILYMVLPVFGFTVLVLLATIAAYLRPVARPGARRFTSNRIMTSKVWNVGIWFLLIVYPSVSRKALFVFYRAELRGQAYLRSNTDEELFASHWCATVATL